MIEITGLKHCILDIPSLAITPGQTALIGPNGAGKSTLLRLCAGIEAPHQGRVTINGQSPREVDVGWVDEFPDRTLLFDKVDDEIASSLSFRRAPRRTLVQEGKTAARVCGITHLMGKRCKELSGGEKVLVALVGALVSKPHVLLLDEFDSHLDPFTARKVRDCFGTWSTPTIVYCTQDMEAAAGADCVVYLEKGQVTLRGPPVDVFSHLAHTCYYPLRWRMARCR